jgi:hypothetical protein
MMEVMVLIAWFTLVPFNFGDESASKRAGAERT